MYSTENDNYINDKNYMESLVILNTILFICFVPAVVLFGLPPAYIIVPIGFNIIMYLFINFYVKSNKNILTTTSLYISFIVFNIIAFILLRVIQANNRQNKNLPERTQPPAGHHS